MSAFDPNRWTIKTQEAFRAATEAARARNNPEVTPEHVLAALIAQEDGVVLPIVERLGMAPLELRNRLEAQLGRLPKAYGGADPQI
ncbi:MAG: hypothetical protein M3N15_01540, partial [Actinomycetota bacterium]|nr:hypothetical protein [Actinomycetota bacterium]